MIYLKGIMIIMSDDDDCHGRSDAADDDYP